MVKKRSASYWDKRSVARLLNSETAVDRHANDVKRIYNKAHKEVQASIDQIYTTYLGTQGIDVKALTEKLSVAQSQAFWLKMKAQGHLDYIGANYKSRISRLEQIQGDVYDKIASIRTPETAVQTEAHAQTINEGFNRTVFDTAKGVDANIAFTGLNTGVLDTMLTRNWAGANYSNRIWNNTNMLANNVKDMLGSSLLTGRSPLSMSAALQEKFAVAQYVADRLIRTETNYFQNESSAEAHKAMGLEEYKFVATLDSSTSQTCQDHDDKIYKLKDKNTGVNYPPLHPNCRSTTRAYLGDDYEPTTRTARNADGKNVEVQQMSYEQWKAVNNVPVVQPTATPVPTPIKVTQATVTKSDAVVVKTKPKTVALPIQPISRGVDQAITQVMTEGMNDVYTKYPMAFDRLDRVMFSKTMARDGNINGVYNFGVGVANKRYMKDSAGKLLTDEHGRVRIIGDLNVAQKISARVPAGRNTIDRYAERVKDLSDQGWWATQNPKGVIYHELGHSLEQTLIMKREGLFELYDDLKLNGQGIEYGKRLDDIRTINNTMKRHSVSRDIMEKTLKEAHPEKSMYSATKENVSKYANKSSAEAFAEMFTKLMSGDTDKVTKVFEKNLNAEMKGLGLL